MSRLTEKISSEMGGVYRPTVVSWDICKKLGQLEDIEEMFGISLSIILNAYFDGFYINGGFVQGGEYFLELCLQTKSFRLKSTDDKYYFKDYGKTWALTKEKLEK